MAASSPENPTAVDYLVMTLSPVLIMGLIGSLVFFLVEVLYAGQYEGRLLWTLFFFVVGIVLVARISIQIDAARSAMYGLALSVVCWLALLTVIEYPKGSTGASWGWLIHIGLMALIWWCANKLTWDCTYIDEDRPSSSQGLLAAAGMEPSTALRRTIEQDEAEPRDPPRRSRKRGLSAWLDRYQRFRERRAKRPHTPGLTVVYFSLAALPIFGLGQSLIPASEGDRRGFAFRLAFVYVGCALGLLLTTSFLGLRRYLRQRKVRMPWQMTGTWLGLGSLIIIAFLVVAALLPRPYSETPIWGLNRLVSPERDASRNAILRDSAGKGNGQAGNMQQAGEGEGSGKQGPPGGTGKGKGKDGGSEREKGDPDGNDRSGAGNEKQSAQTADKSRAKDRDSASSRTSSGQDLDGKSSDGGRSGRSTPETKLGQSLEKIATFLKWLVFALFALVVVFLVLRWGLQYLANFTQWARSLLEWWNRLLASWWGAKDQVPAGSSMDVPVASSRPCRPFHSYSNPFVDGTAEGRSIEELVQYSFEALEAWAADRLHPRVPSETALEFSARLSNQFPSLGNVVHRLAVVMAQRLYAHHPLKRDEVLRVLEPFWDRVTTLMPEPASV